MKIPFFDIAAQYRALRPDIDAALRRVLESGSYSNATENLAFEQELATYLGVREVVAVNSGTDALLLSLKALGIGAGDEVIVPSFTFFATAEAVCLAGAKSRFADCGSTGFNIDLHSIERAYSAATKAVIAVHLYGHPVDLAPIQQFCAARNLHLIEDCAQALGASYRGQRVGTFGITGAFSFYPTKNLGACGDGGAIACADSKIAAHLRRLRNHGRISAHNHAEIGINSRLDEIQAAILRVKLPHLDRWNMQRRVLAQRYSSGLRDTRCGLPSDCDNGVGVFQHFVITHPQRDALAVFLARHDVETAIYYPTPCHLQAAFSNSSDLPALPWAQHSATQTLALPIYPELTDANVDHIVALVRAFEQA